MGGSGWKVGGGGWRWVNGLVYPVKDVADNEEFENIRNYYIRTELCNQTQSYC